MFRRHEGTGSESVLLVLESEKEIGDVILRVFAKGGFREETKTDAGQRGQEEIAHRQGD